MKIGVPKEIKTNENRVALVPAGAEALVAAGHEVYVEASAGEGSGLSGAAYPAGGDPRPPGPGGRGGARGRRPRGVRRGERRRGQRLLRRRLHGRGRQDRP